MAIGTGNGLTLVDELDELIDVVITAPTNGQSLVFDSATNRWVNASAAGGGVGTVASVSAGIGLSASPNPITGTGEIFLTNTAVSAGDYTLASITVDAQGRITAAANGAAGSGTVTSAGITGSDGIGVAGSPITTEGQFTLSLGNITPDNIVTGVVSATTLNVTGDLQAATGRVTASAATISALLTGSTATFSGIVSANAGLRATTVSASGVIGGSNLSGTNTGDQTITLTGDVSGTGTASMTTTINPGTVTNAKMANMNAFTIKSNIQSSAAVPTDNSLSAVIDAGVSGSVWGDILYRADGIWNNLGAGTTGQVLTTGGVSANPSWEDAAATGVTSVSAGIGLSASPNPITGTGEIFLTDTAVSAGSYTLTSITVDQQGRITAASNGMAGTGTVTSAGITGTDGIGVAGSPITTEGQFTLSLGNITPDNITTGIVSASNLNVTGNIIGSDATLTGPLAGAAASFSGIVSANGGLRAAALTATTGNFSGTLTGAAATFSGIVSANAGLVSTTGSFSGLLTGSTATFSGIVSANAGLRATTVSASGVIGGSNLSGTNTGDQTITLTGDVSGTGTGSFAATVNPGVITNAKLANMNAFTIKSNVNSSAAVPADNTFSTVLDASVSGAAHGDILYRGNGTWAKLTAGTSGQALITSGVSANPFWGTVPISAGGTGSTTAIEAARAMNGCYVLGNSASAAILTGTTSASTMALVNVPANAMGANGFIEVICTMAVSANDASSKNIRILFNGTNYGSLNMTNTISNNMYRVIMNRNATNSQVGLVSTTRPEVFGVASIGSPPTSTHDTTTSLNITFQGELADANDTLRLEMYRVILYPR